MGVKVDFDQGSYGADIEQLMWLTLMIDGRIEKALAATSWEAEKSREAFLNCICVYFRRHFL